MRYVWIIVIGIFLAGVIVLATNRDPETPLPEELSTSPPREVMVLEPITSETYQIQENDTLSSIAQRRWGNARLWRRIVEVNPGLGEPDAIKVGDTISLPPFESFSTAESLVADLDDGRESRPSSTQPTEKPPAVPSNAEGLQLGLDHEILGATVVPGTLLRNDEGNIVADEKYTILGAGTQEDPYRVDWKLLASAGELYRPNLNQRSMPQRIAALDGTWVEISGYIAFPLPHDTSEMIVMLNQWDGCCIGVPPTPYDAIEVKLNQSVNPGRRHTVKYGTVTGELFVEPYLIENWLVGLYLMNNATVKLES